ncbi:MAG: biopolymer transporter ExbD [Candidatus Firestonebacteria bacterium]
MRLKKRKTYKRGRIELIPLIDTILMLLIFYMSFGKLVKEERKLEASLPAYASDTSSEISSSITVEVTGGGKLIVNDEEYTLEGFSNMLSGLSLVSETVSIVLKGKENIFYQDIIDALNACARNGIKNVSFVPLE